MKNIIIETCKKSHLWSMKFVFYYQPFTNEVFYQKIKWSFKANTAKLLWQLTKISDDRIKISIFVLYAHQRIWCRNILLRQLFLGCYFSQIESRTIINWKCTSLKFLDHNFLILSALKYTTPYVVQCSRWKSVQFMFLFTL